MIGQDGADFFLEEFNLVARPLGGSRPLSHGRCEKNGSKAGYKKTSPIRHILPSIVLSPFDGIKSGTGGCHPGLWIA